MSKTISANSTKQPKKKIPSLTAFLAINNEVLFNPKEKGPMSILADQNSPEYHKIAAKIALERNDLLLAHQHILLARFYA